MWCSGFRVRKEARLLRCKRTGPSSQPEWDKLRSPTQSYVTRTWKGWEERKLQAKNTFFYYNSSTGASQWDQPEQWCVR